MTNDLMTNDLMTVLGIGGRHEETQQVKSPQGKIETEEPSGLYEEVEG
jgi:hypothetical protein